MDAQSPRATQLISPTTISNLRGRFGEVGQRGMTVPVVFHGTRRDFIGVRFRYRDDGTARSVLNEA